MTHIWRYIMVVLCVAVTSARVMNYPGNRKDLHDNVISRMKEGKVLTPPSNNGLNIDSSGYPGNSNDMVEMKNNWENNGPVDNISFFKKILTALQDQNNELNDYQLVMFNKEDFNKLEGSEICKTLCSNKVAQPPCKC